MLQGLAVLTGILVAFGIDAWWDNRQERVAESRALEQLEEEFAANLQRLDSAVAFHGDVERAATTMLNIAAQPEPGVSGDSIDHLLGDLSWWGGSNWVTGSVEALISSGEIRLIQNEDLRAAIAAWPRAIARVTATEDQEFKTHHEFWISFLVREGYLAQISNAITHRPGSDVTWEAGVSVQLVPGGFDHTRLLGNREFQNMVLIKQWDQIDLRVEYETLRTRLDGTLEMIRAERAR